MAELGFIGLGIMGKPMASHLVKAGHTVHVCDLAEESVRHVCSLGGKACSWQQGDCPEIRYHFYYGA